MRGNWAVMLAIVLVPACGEEGYSTPVEGTGAEPPTIEGVPLFCFKGSEQTAARRGWNFESGTAEGWTLNPRFSFPSSRLETTTANAHSGKYALATEFAQTPSVTSIELRSDLCPPDMNVDLWSRSLSAWVFIEGPQVPDGSSCSFLFDGWSRYNFEEDIIRAEAGIWFRLSGALRSADPGWRSHPLTLAIQCVFGRGTVPWSGKVLVDDVRVE